MKKYISIILVLIIVAGLTACGKDDASTTTTGTTAVVEMAESHPEIDNNNGGMVLTMDEDTIMALLGDFTSEQLRITGDIYDYTLKLSMEEYGGMNGCRVEAIPAGGNTAESIFFINGNVCLVYDNAQQKYVSILSGNVDTTVPNEDVDDGAIEESAPVTNPNLSDSPVDFQYHEENNRLLHERFSKYDLSPVGMSKSLSEYIFLVTTRTATIDNKPVSVVEVYEKDGTLTVYRFGLGADKDYYYDYESQSYVELAE